MNFKEFISFLKLPPNILAALSLVSGIIIFSPTKIIEKFYMKDFRDKFGFLISLIFLICISLLIVLLFCKLYKYLKKIYDNKKMKRAQIKYLLEAEEYKVKLISKFMKETTHTLSIQENDGLTAELKHLGIIAIAGSTQPMNFDFDNNIFLRYFLQPWVVKMINENDDLKKKYKVK